MAARGDLGRAQALALGPGRARLARGGGRVIHIARARSPSPPSALASGRARCPRHRHVRRDRFSLRRDGGCARSDVAHRGRDGRRRPAGVRDPGRGLDDRQANRGTEPRAGRRDPRRPRCKPRRCTLARRPDRLPLAAAEWPTHPAFRPGAIGLAGRGRTSRSMTASTSRRSAATGSSRRMTAWSLPPGGVTTMRIGWLGDLTRVLPAARCQEALEHPADRGRDRRRQRLSEHVRPLREGRREAGPTGDGRRPARLRGPDRTRLGLPPALRDLQPIRAGRVRDRSRHRQANEAASGSRSPGSTRSSSSRPLEADAKPTPTDAAGRPAPYRRR